ncbi:hypothetical protein V5799_021260 [Amblyomma americanum]|uniref:VWFA domain-containing protein n=1 Tax=Amblyomma americanum TaxID=6943 RepID=A0AAQ4FNP8_AMBAM
MLFAFIGCGMWLIPVLLALSVSGPPAHGLRMNKDTGAYEDVVVAIHRYVEPDERIIENIKALFRSASALMHRATCGLVHFGSVTISVPDTWPARPQAAGTAASLFPVAAVRVAAANPRYGDTPYTVQPRGCGESGEYIHLTARFLADMNGSIAEEYGDPAFQLVHEWAHFRYGVFDEYGYPESSRYPSLYCESGMVRASTCSQQLKFSAFTESGERCRIYKGCRVSSKCKTRFSPKGGDPVTSSIMFMPHVEGKLKFCDKTRHNAFAPNKHNHLCNRKPTWEVISGNQDFINLPRGDLTRNIEMTFHEVQNKDGVLGEIVFALDVSSSMGNANRIVHLRAAATHFIEVLVPDGLKVGLVTFSTSAADAFPLAPLRRRERERLVEIVKRLGPGGSTCIGCALRTALEMLTANNRRADGSVIILMTDGNENHAPTMADVMDELVSAGVLVNTIAFGMKADRKLEELALRTGGKPFALRDGQSNVATALESAFLDSTITLLDYAQRPVVVFDGAAKVGNESRFPILIDADLGNRTTITVTSDRASAVKAELRYPDGKPFSDCLKLGPEVVGSSLTYKIPGIATPGTWTLVVSRSGGSSEVDVHVRATSFASDPKGEPVMVRAFLKRTEVSRAADAVVYAEVTKGSRFVLHARVTATVIRPQEPHEVQVKLLDDGLGSDVTADDGIYSGYFTQFGGVGRYSVSARVVSADDSIIVSGRMASGGLPARQSSGTCRAVEAAASRLELRASQFLGDLISNFESAPKITAILDDEDDNDAGGASRGGRNFPPGAAGSRQWRQVYLPNALLYSYGRKGHSLPHFYVAAVVWNADGLNSSLSNVARITFERPPTIAELSAAASVRETVIVIIVAMLAFSVAFFLMMRMILRRNNREREIY